MYTYKPTCTGCAEEVEAGCRCANCGTDAPRSTFRVDLDPPALTPKYDRPLATR